MDPPEGSLEWRIANLEAEVASLWANVNGHQRRLKPIEDRFETLMTPPWKRFLFRLDGWGPWWYVNKTGPKRRPWRRWFTS